MDTRIQFRVDEETKRLAQEMAASQGRTLSDACRELTEQLAEQQRVREYQDQWLTHQVNEAFAKYEAGATQFLDDDSAEREMNDRKARIREKLRK